MQNRPGAVKALHLKAINKGNEKNQSSKNVPTIVVIDMGTVRDSEFLRFMEPIQPLEVDFSEIPDTVDAVVVYWHNLEMIKPWYVKGFVRPSSPWYDDLHKILGLIVG